MKTAYRLIPLILLGPFLVNALSISDLQAQVQHLLQQITELQAQLGGQTGTITPPVGASHQCTLYRTLGIGMAGNDVTCLQEFLARDSLIYPERMISGYFGALTEKAVQRFQAKYNIVSYGNSQTTGYGTVGPRTRSTILSLQTTSVSATAPTPPPTPLPPPSNSLLDVFPLSGVASRHTDQWTFTKNDTFLPGTEWSAHGLVQNGAPSYGALDENQVFHTRLIHSQDSSTSYELRIGKGSQIYSFRGPLGEAIPPQRTGKAEWMDEVIQTVMTNSVLNVESAGETEDQIHLAGVYKNMSAHLTQPFYSPLLAENFDSGKDSYSTMVWPQQAHQPSQFGFVSTLMLYQNIRDIGDGIFEVTYVYHNYGTTTPFNMVDRLSAPWFSLRYSTVPLTLVSAPDGTYTEQSRHWPSTTKIPDTGGWFAFAKENAPSSSGIGLVYGTDKHASPFYFVRWGNLDANPSQVARDSKVVSLLRQVQLNPGESYFVRYYVVVNTLQHIQTYANQLASSADYGPLEFLEKDTPLISACPTHIGEYSLKTPCPSGESPLFYSYSKPIRDAQPLFLLRNVATGQLSLTNDPYLISNAPYDDRTSYVGFLGWAVSAASRNTTCFDYANLSTLVSDRNFYPNPLTNHLQRELYVRSSLTNRCP